MTELHRALARNLKARRAALGISQIALAERAELSYGYIGELELGNKFPTAEVLERLAAALGIRPYRLLMTQEDLRDVAETTTKEVIYAAASELRSRISREIDELLGPPPNSEAPR